MNRPGQRFNAEPAIYSRQRSSGVTAGSPLGDGDIGVVFDSALTRRVSGAAAGDRGVAELTRRRDQVRTERGASDVPSAGGFRGAVPVRRISVAESKNDAVSKK